MKRIIITIVIVTQIYFNNSHSQGVWTQKADFGGTGRYSAAGFSIGTKGYIGTGRNLPSTTYQDFWEYDPSNDSWMQKADFGGTPRQGAVGFSIGNKGYIGTGADGTGNKDDFWEYDPANNSWKQIADYPGGTSWGAVSFVIGSKAYMGMGWSGIGRKDFWEYNPGTDSWSQIASCPGPGGGPAAGFSIDGKGYVGTGNDSANNSPSNQFWEYDPADDIQPLGIKDISGQEMLHLKIFGSSHQTEVESQRTKILWNYLSSLTLLPISSPSSTNPKQKILLLKLLTLREEKFQVSSFKF